MTIKSIRNDEDLTTVFRRLEYLFQAEEQSPEADERDMLVKLVEAYENKHFDFDLVEHMTMSGKAQS